MTYVYEVELKYKKELMHKMQDWITHKFFKSEAEALERILLLKEQTRLYDYRITTYEMVHMRDL